jgi:hypothetical protein
MSHRRATTNAVIQVDDDPAPAMDATPSNTRPLNTLGWNTDTIAAAGDVMMASTMDSAARRELELF